MIKTEVHSISNNVPLEKCCKDDSLKEAIKNPSNSKLVCKINQNDKKNNEVNFKNNQLIVIPTGSEKIIEIEVDFNLI